MDDLMRSGVALTACGSLSTLRGHESVAIARSTANQSSRPGTVCAQPYLSPDLRIRKEMSV